MKKVISTILFIGIYQIFNSQVTDVDGKKYKSAKFGSQVWMLENLSVSRFRNGDLIKEVKSKEEWDQATNNGESVWCYYENRSVQSDPINGNLYGKLYNWYAINDPRCLSPKGWHVPSFDEWTTLFNFVGGIDLAAYKLKSINSWEAFKNWDYDQNKSYIIKEFTGGINFLGFNAVPSGKIDHVIGFFNTKGIMCQWWSTSVNYNVPMKIAKDFDIVEGIEYCETSFNECQKDQIITIQMYHHSDNVIIVSNCKTDGFSVRCIKD